VYAPAVRGLLELEPNPERQLNYLDFVDIYAHLSEDERMIYQQNLPPEAAAITSLVGKDGARALLKALGTGLS